MSVYHVDFTARRVLAVVGEEDPIACERQRLHRILDDARERLHHQAPWTAIPDADTAIADAVRLVATVGERPHRVSYARKGVSFALDAVERAIASAPRRGHR